MNSRTYSEVYQLIQYLSENEYIRIPKEKIKFLKENMDNDMEKFYTITTNINEIELSSEAKIIFMSLFYNYIANDDQKIKLRNFIANKEEEEKSKKYNPDDIFKKVNKEECINLEATKKSTNTELIEYKESFFTKFKNFILRILHINK